MSFFQTNYQTPAWYQKKISRRNMLKSAAGAVAVASLPKFAIAKPEALAEITATDPWLTLNAVLNHLLPSSSSGPGAKEIQATHYLYQLMAYQPVEKDEKAFIFKGVGWLNSYSQSQHQSNFITLNEQERDNLLRGISASSAGENWLNTLITYIYEAMLSPPVYGGNPKGVGWQWLEHQAGFPLPAKGQRYYEIDGHYKISIKTLTVAEKTKS